MKKVVNGKCLREKMDEAIDLICDAVSSTLGPSGNNVLINNELSPFITNDGVTIAESIASEDKIVNTILEIIKEASLKTNELVGDGTTTTLVLLKSIFKEGLKLIENGKNAIILKQELDDSLNSCLNILESFKREPTKNDLINIAKTSCSDYKLGEYLTKIFLKMKSKYAIKLCDSDYEKTSVKYNKGYSFDLDNITNMYFLSQNKINLKNVNILLLKGYLDDLEVLSEAINENKNLVILATDASDLVKEEILSYYLDYKKNIFLFLLPDYPSKRYAILNDLNVISGANIKNVNEDISFADLGQIENITITKDEITFSVDKNIDFYIENLKNELKTLSEFDAYFMKERICKLESGIATIYVGGISKTEMKEKKMRMEDAINALEVASKGVTIGSGIKYLEMSDKLELNNDGARVLAKSLKKPFQKIMENCGENYSDWQDLIKDSNYEKIYNLKTKVLEESKAASVMDPIQVLEVALKNATSIAAMLLTTNYLVINENINNNNEM